MPEEIEEWLGENQTFTPRWVGLVWEDSVHFACGITLEFFLVDVLQLLKLKCRFKSPLG